LHQGTITTRSALSGSAQTRYTLGWGYIDVPVGLPYYLMLFERKIHAWQACLKRGYDRS